MQTHLGEMSEEQWQRLRHDPRAFMRASLRHPNDPKRHYDFKTTNGETELAYLLDDDGPLNPENWGDINVLKWGRGCLKTTVVTSIAAWCHSMYLPEGIQGYMTAPREKPPVKGFMETFDEKVRQVGLDEYRETNNQKYQNFEAQFADGNDGSYLVKSILEADSGYDPDTLRGPHSHYGVIDEVQDIGQTAFQVYSQCIDRLVPNVDYFPAIFIIGTPKRTGSWYHDLWQMTDQRRWDADEKAWIQESEPETFSPDEDLLEKSGADFDESDIPEKTVKGWHVDHYDSPLHSPADIARDRETMGDQEFANEVEAKFRDPENNLLMEETLRERVFDTELDFSENRQFTESEVTLGVDWGGGSDRKAADTVICVVEWLDMEGETEGIVRKIDFLDHSLSASEEVEEVERNLIKFDVDSAVVDHGHGYKSVEDLQNGTNTLDNSGYMDTVVACRFGNIANKSELKWESSSGQRRFFTADKTHSADSFVANVRDGVYTLPASDTIESDGSDQRKIINHLTAPYKELDTTTSGRKKTRITTDDTRNDDCFDALIYNDLAHYKVDPSISMGTTVGMQKRPGSR